MVQQRHRPEGTRSTSRTATEHVFSGCRDGAEIVLWKLSGAGHVWPGARDCLPRSLGPGSDVIDANEAMWRFFKRFQLPPARP